MKLIEEKFEYADSNGSNAIAIDVGDDIIKQYILEHAKLERTAIAQMGECDECGCADSHIYEERSIYNEVTPEHVLSDEWITVMVDGEQYAVRKVFYEMIYNSNLDLLTEEIKDNYDDFTGFSVAFCPKCQKWSVGD
ncbi:hypothetical protein bcere0004_56730 [Bacillus cereus BGSC 6E1]|nr:hypothetical protein bcere0004_56730 [Bacillus cereus BGSC 6E1]